MGRIVPFYTPSLTVTHTPSTEWFNMPILKALGLAPVPGTPDADAMAELGQINIPFPSTLNVVHLHQGKDGASNTTNLELYRRRSGVFTQIGSVSLASGGGDFSTTNFMITDPSLQAWDYLFCQATSVIQGGGKPAGFVDVHFAPVVLR